MDEPFVHATAVVDEGASVGPRSSVWHFSHVMAGASIGSDCSLGQNVFIGRGVQIGDGCKIQNNVSVYEGVELEDHVFCGPSLVFTNVRAPRAAYPTVPDAYERTLVRRGATLGANATIVCGVIVGSWAFVAAGAVVTDDVPDHGLMAGVPARRIGWSCECGRTLHVEDGEGRCSCGRAYRTIGDALEATG